MTKKRIIVAVLAAALGAYVGYLAISKADCRNSGGVLAMGVMEFVCVVPATSLNRHKRQQRTMEALSGCHPATAVLCNNMTALNQHLHISIGYGSVNRAVNNQQRIAL
ncbi:hypothetical protein ED236_00275 [Pseudomethylobacillus aquaticus]|uniref:Uncharacterized protein n=1 Tax=Pseudomethylobacillus aquaticus TaxID=2676064 RepID=A0A3N0V5W4_9PROT|nr:hypothetical protein [Pseudomethylobacillus aquaticus]ROH87964.1 hypothetical protein ED236_00275 [Pseudomethylobacillus aquaticus]